MTVGVPVGMPDVALEVDFGDAQGAIVGHADRGLIGTATVGGTFDYVDVSADMRRGRITRGFSEFSGVYARSTAGQMSVTLDNRSADYDPTNLSGPYVISGATRVKPRRQVRLYGPAFDVEAYADLDVGAITGDCSTFSGTFDGDIDIRWKMNWPTSPPGAMTIARVTRTSGEDVEFSYGAGNLIIVVKDSGGAILETYSKAFSNWTRFPNPWWLRAVYQPSTGGVSSTRWFYGYYYDTWTAVGSAVNGSTHSTGVDYDFVVIDGQPNLPFLEAEVYNAVGSGLVAEPNMTNLPESTTARTYVDPQGAEWTVPANTIVAPERVPTWAGWVKQWQPEYPPMFDNEATTELVGIDGIGILSGIDQREQTTQGAGEDTGARVSRILTNAGWSSNDRVIDTGIGTCQGTTLAQNAWSEAQLACDTELGELYVDGSGRFVFRNRHALILDDRSAQVQATFGDDPDEGEFEFVDMSITYDDEQIYNDVLIGRSGGTAQNATDATSVTEYGTRTFTRTDLIHQSDDVSEGYAAYVLALFKDPKVRIDSITLNARSSSEVQYQAFTREIGDRILVRIRPPGRGGSAIEREGFIRGITHEWDYLTLTWTTRFALQDADRFAVARVGFAVIGTDRIGF